MFFETPCYFFPCSFCLGSCCVLENGESIIPVESDVVCSVFVCEAVQDENPTFSVLVSDLPADHVSVKRRVTEKLCLIDMSNFQIFTYIYIYI